MNVNCVTCRDDEPCELHCAVCGGDVFDGEIATYSVVRWLPEAQINIHVITVCSPCWDALPLP